MNPAPYSKISTKRKSSETAKVSKETKEQSETSDKTAEFIKKNWPAALLVAGTAVGAAIWLTSKYLRNKKAREREIELKMEQVENETMSQSDPTVAMLEHGSYLGRIAGDEVQKATEEIVLHIENPDEKEIFKTLGEVAQIETKNRKT